MNKPNSPRNPAIRVTPLLPTPSVLGPGVFVKCENLQVTGSFKIRGAWAALSRLPQGSRENGVVAVSAGNHGAGLALAGRMLATPVTVVVPHGTPEVKKNTILRLGAELLIRGDTYDQAEQFAKQLAAEQAKRFVSPFDDDDVIFGNGHSLGDEIFEQMPEVKTVIAPVGGGGLLAGLAQSLVPRGIEVVGAQPENNCAMAESLRDGKAYVCYEGRPTIAEGCEGGISERTFAICQPLIHRIELISESAIANAVKFAYEAMGQVVEASGAVGLAAALKTVQAKDTVIVLSGGNIDAAKLDALLAR